MSAIRWWTWGLALAAMSLATGNSASAQMPGGVPGGWGQQVGFQSFQGPGFAGASGGFTFGNGGNLAGSGFGGVGAGFGAPLGQGIAGGGAPGLGGGAPGLGGIAPGMTGFGAGLPGMGQMRGGPGVSNQLIPLGGTIRRNVRRRGR